MEKKKNKRLNLKIPQLDLKLAILSKANLASSSPLCLKDQNSYSGLFQKYPENISNLWSSTNRNSIYLRKNATFLNYFSIDPFENNSKNQEKLDSIYCEDPCENNSKNQEKLDSIYCEDLSENNSKNQEELDSINFSPEEDVEKRKFFINPLSFDYLISLFLNKEIKIDLKKLNLESKSLIFFILHRKMNKKKNNFKKNKVLDDNLLKEKINEFKNFLSVKRFLENLTFVFRAFINYQKTLLELNNKQIHNYYFEKISIEKNINLKYFLNPSKKNNPVFKNFSEKFLKLIIISPLFKKDFIHFLNFILIENYLLKKVKKKFMNTLKKLEKDFIENMEKQEIYDEKIFYNYLIKNNQCKLPWCISELKVAIQEVISKIDN